MECIHLLIKKSKLFVAEHPQLDRSLSHDLSKPFEFRVDQRKVISGIDEIVKLMTKGEEVYCIIPAKLGHGEKGVKGHIDSNSILYIYLQIIDIK